MRTLVLVSSFAALLVCSVVACSDDEASPATVPTSDAGPAGDPVATEDGGGPTEEAGATYVEPECTLRSDTGGPGQYTDTCVQRSWIAAYAGTYTSATCELTIDITGGVAATFEATITGGPLAGEYSIDWDGAPSPGNDSYYRFTTDATFATTKTINFTAGQKVGASDERALSLRIEGIDVGAPVYQGRAYQVIGGANTEHDCGTMTKK